MHISRFRYLQRLVFGSLSLSLSLSLFDAFFVLFWNTSLIKAGSGSFVIPASLYLGADHCASAKITLFLVAALFVVFFSRTSLSGWPSEPSQQG